MIPWSAEGELRLRKRILLLRMTFFLSLAAGLASLLAGLSLPHYRFLIFGIFVWIIGAACLGSTAGLIEQLGFEETIWRGQRIPGRGMLANKPRDTSRLTRWVRHKRDEAPLGFTCECWCPYDWSAMKWTANVLEDEDEQGTLERSNVETLERSVDPEGGRWVLICPCGIGHYMLAADD